MNYLEELDTVYYDMDGKLFYDQFCDSYPVLCPFHKEQCSIYCVHCRYDSVYNRIMIRCGGEPHGYYVKEQQ